MKIDLTDDQVDSIVLQEFQRHIKILDSNIKELSKRKNKLKKFEKEDLKRYREVTTAMKVMIGYYGSHLIK